MPNAPEPAEELAFDEHAPDPDDRVSVLRDNDDGVVRPRAGAHGVELRLPGIQTGIWSNGEDREDFEVSAGVVCRGEGTNLRAEE